MHFRCVIIMFKCCVLVGLDWVEPMMLLMLHITCSCIFMHMYLHFFIFLYWTVWCFSICLLLSLFLLLVALWHLNKNLLCPRTLFIPRHFLLLPPLILLHLMSGSVMIKLVRTSWKTSHNKAFIRNAKSFYRIFSILTFPLSSTVEIGSHCVASWSLVPP